MDPRLIVILAGLFVAIVGYVFLAPEQFEFLGLPNGFAGLGMERVVTGLALMLLGFIGALSEIQDQPKRRRARAFAFAEEPALAEGGPAARPPGLLLQDDEPEAAPTVPESDSPVIPTLPSRYTERPPEP